MNQRGKYMNTQTFKESFSCFCTVQKHCFCTVQHPVSMLYTNIFSDELWFFFLTSHIRNIVFFLHMFNHEVTICTVTALKHILLFVLWK